MENHRAPRPGIEADKEGDAADMGPQATRPPGKASANYGASRQRAGAGSRTASGISRWRRAEMPGRSNELPPPVSNRRVSLRSLFFLMLALTSPGWLPAAETLAEKSLREIVAREKALFAQAQAEGDALDEARFAGEAQAIARSYDVLIQKNPEFAPAFVTYGLFLEKIDMNRAAVAMLLKANKLDPHIPLVKNQLAKLLAEDGKPVDALPYLMSAIELEPREPLYHFHLAQLLLAGRDDFIRAGEWTRAALDRAMLEAFARAAELAPDDLSLAYQHAKAYYEIDPPRWEEALGFWERLEGRAPRAQMRQLIKLQRANILVQLGRAADASRLLDEVTDLNLAGEKQQVLDALAAKKKAAPQEAAAAKP